MDKNKIENIKFGVLCGLISFLSITIISWISLIIFPESIYGLIFFELINLVVFFALMYLALDLSYKRTKTFSNAPAWLVLIFYLIFDKLVLLVILLINKSNKLVEIIDSLLNFNVGIFVIFFPLIVSDIYKKRNNVKLKKQKIIRTEFFKNNSFIISTSIILTIFIVMFFLWLDLYSLLASIENYSSIAAITFAIFVILTILFSYFIGCLLNYLKEKGNK